ncbi:hypothetical protein DFH08DRAFT_714632 [Mycena albidolilacea]|uniref:Uncharacterized protein n=1 Tax=Mycena albidolilacea TaxID=1033008 RepID=A0AAD7EG24_9AGAR|nr:hypothetical protein DFH08DRAFT_714632 [Mycena albidolilacea]
MLQAAQPYPGDTNSPPLEDNFAEKRFLMYLISDKEYVIADRENIGIDDLTIRIELLHQEDFQPALWYAQTRAEKLGIEWNEGCTEERYLEPIGDVEAGVVQLLLESYQ